jgi:hypothetical protein
VTVEKVERTRVLEVLVDLADAARASEEAGRDRYVWVIVVALA